MLFNAIKKLSLLLLPLSSLAADIAMVIIEGADKDNYSSAIKTCTDYRIEYEAINIPQEGLEGDINELFYENVNGVASAKYKVLVFPNGRISYKNGKTWKSAITDTQWLQIEQYARENDARLVFLNEYPSAATGTKLYKDCTAGEECKFDLTHKVIAGQNAILGEEVNDANLIVNKDIYHVPAAIDPNVQGISVEPVMYFSEAPPDYPEKTIAAVTVGKEGANLMAFYMAFGEWSKESSALNVVWLSWATGMDLKHLNGGSINSDNALKDAASGDIKSMSLEVIFVTLSTVFTILITLF